MLRSIWRSFRSLFNLLPVDDKPISIEQRLDIIERRQVSIVIYVFIIVLGFSAIIIGASLHNASDPLLGKVFLIFGMCLLVFTCLTVLFKR